MARRLLLLMALAAASVNACSSHDAGLNEEALVAPGFDASAAQSEAGEDEAAIMAPPFDAGEPWIALEADVVPEVNRDSSGDGALTVDAALDLDAVSPAAGKDAGMGLSEASADVASSEADVLVWPTLCGRLARSAESSRTVALAFEADMYRDCRVKWFATLYFDVDQREAFVSNLIHWNRVLWGCSSERSSEFDLIFRPVALSSFDAANLIDHYLVSVDDTLVLSPGEKVTLRAALNSLAAPLVDAALLDYGHALCPADAGSELAAHTDIDASAESTPGDANGATNDDAANADDVEHERL